MTADVQQILSLALVALAAMGLFWRVFAPWFRGETPPGCSTGCSQCPANQSSAQTPTGLQLVQVQLPVKHRENQ